MAYNQLVPMFGGYQLIGDSQLLRFAKTILSASPLLTGNLRHLGLCVSGQTINDLVFRMKSHFYPVGTKVILLIGTNDLLQNVPLAKMLEDLKELIDGLCTVTRRLVILTVPPIPRCAANASFWLKLDAFNDAIRSYARGNAPRIMLVDACYLFTTGGRLPRAECFESAYNDGRPDLVHLNVRGLNLLKDLLTLERFLE